MENNIKNGIDSKLFAERVREARGKLSQREFGEKCMLTAQAISKYENADDEDGRLPSIENAAAIAKAAGVSLDWLAGLSDEKSLNGQSKNNMQFETYWDLYLLLRKIACIFGGSLTVKKVKHENEWDEDINDYVSYEAREVTLTIPDELLARFHETAEAIDNLAEKEWKVGGLISIHETARLGLQKKMEMIEIPFQRNDDVWIESR